MTYSLVLHYPLLALFFQVFMLRDKGLMRFVFNDPPTDIKRKISEIESAVAQALSSPLSVKIYDTQFHSKRDGSLDFSATR